MKTGIVTTGHFYRQLLERLLSVLELPPYVVVAGGESSGTLMLAASIRRSHDMPVVAVVNSDTVEPALIAEQQEMREYLMRGGASPGIPSRFIPAVPQVETVLFSDPEALGCILGRRLTEREMIEGEFRPRAVLDRLLAEAGMDRDVLLEKISPKTAARFAAHPLIRSLARFVEEASSAVTEAAA